MVTSARSFRCLKEIRQTTGATLHPLKLWQPRGIDLVPFRSLFPIRMLAPGAEAEKEGSKVKEEADRAVLPFIYNII